MSALPVKHVTVLAATFITVSSMVVRHSRLKLVCEREAHKRPEGGAIYRVQISLQLPRMISTSLVLFMHLVTVSGL